MTIAGGRMPDSGTIQEYLDTVADAGRLAMTAALLSHRAQLGLVHQADLDISAWVAEISGPTAEQMHAARKELALAEYCAASGLYRQAYTSLRLFLELSFASVHFSVNEFQRRLWLSDRLDFSWSSALKNEDGLLSASFVREFAPTLVIDAQSFATDVHECYRHCSQFVHGKSRQGNTLPERITHSDEILSDWCSTALRAARAVLFLLYVRYGDDFDVNGNADLQEILIQHFGNLPAIRGLVGLSED